MTIKSVHDAKAPRSIANRDELFTMFHGGMVHGFAGESAMVRRVAKALFRRPADRLTEDAVAHDRDLGDVGLVRASLRALERRGVAVHVHRGERRARLEYGLSAFPGPLLVVANHPGIFDGFAVQAAVGRDDMKIVAADSALWRAMPNVQARLLSLGAGMAGVLACRRAMGHLGNGGAVLYTPAGRIEPDPRIARAGVDLIGPWSSALATLVHSTSRASKRLRVLPVVVSGVVSARADAIADLFMGDHPRSFDFTQLIQLTLPGFTDIDVQIRMGEAIPAERLGSSPALAIRERMSALAREARGA